MGAEASFYSTIYCILLAVVLGLRAVVPKDIFLIDQNVVKAKCSNIVCLPVR